MGAVPRLLNQPAATGDLQESDAFLCRVVGHGEEVSGLAVVNRPWPVARLAAMESAAGLRLGALVGYTAFSCSADLPLTCSIAAQAAIGATGVDSKPPRAGASKRDLKAAVAVPSPSVFAFLWGPGGAKDVE